MLRKIIPALIFCFSILYSAAGGFDIRTSSIIEYPSVEVMGFYNNCWYAIGFELPGNLNKPPKFQLFKYEAGFKSGKTSVMYNSFGEKTYYLKAAFVQSKISLFYAVSQKRVDAEFMMEKREGHKLLPMIMRQDFDPITLESVGEPVLVFDEKDEYFTASDIELLQSPDQSKLAIFIKPYYKQFKYRLIIIDNKTGETFSKTYDFKWRKEYLQFLKAKLTNSGLLYLATKVRNDVLSLNAPPKNKPQNVYYFFSHDKYGDTSSYKIQSPLNNTQFLGEPNIETLQSGDLVVGFNVYKDAAWKNCQGVSLYKFDKNLNVMSKKDVSPDTKLLSDNNIVDVKKGMEFYNQTVVQILPMKDNRLLLLTEARDSISVDKAGAITRKYGHMIATLLDENLSQKSQQLMPKNQVSGTVSYAFSGCAFTKGNDAYIFYNADWLADEESSMNLQCTRIPGDGTAPVTQKVVNTSNEFYTCVGEVYKSGGNSLLFREEKLVDFGDITKQVKLLEITLK